MTKDMAFTKQVRTISDIGIAVFDSLTATIEVLKAKGLKSGEVSFSLMGAKVNCVIQMPDKKSEIGTLTD